jgi:hypothetical protein
MLNLFQRLQLKIEIPKQACLPARQVRDDKQNLNIQQVVL